MLYYIIPPIVIVISTSILIYFLFRKAQQMPAHDLGSSEAYQPGESNFVRLKEIAVNGWLKILERVMHRAKLMSLKFHNMSNERFHAIRKKRQEIIEQERDEMDNIKKESNLKEDVARVAGSGISSIDRVREEEQKPLVKKNVVRPDISKPTIMVAKNQLEDALIKRIAVNPRDIEAYERLGDYYIETANQKDALECFRQVLRLNPAHHKAKLRIRRIERIMQEKQF